MTSQTNYRQRPPRNRDVEGYELDVYKLVAVALNAPKLAHLTEAQKANVEPGPSPMGLYDGIHAHHIVNNEGVRTQTDSEGAISCYFSYGMTWFEVELDMQDVIECIRYDSDGEPQRINLADNIRTFGDRLENNFAYAANAILTGFEV